MVNLFVGIEMAPPLIDTSIVPEVPVVLYALFDYGLTKDTYIAEDIVQDVFLKLYCANYVEQGELRAYLSKMTANRGKDYLKSWAYRKVQLTEKIFSKNYKVLRNNLVEQEELNALDQAILNLPLKQREVIVYYYLENLSMKEMAELLGRPESTIKSRLKSGKERLKNHLQQQEWEVLLDDELPFNTTARYSEK